MEYTKIQTLFKRSQENHCIMVGDYTNPEFEYFKDMPWEATEKIDGTNIRIQLKPISVNIINHMAEYDLSFGGRTDNANIPATLVKFLTDKFPKEKVLNALKLDIPYNDPNNLIKTISDMPEYTIYGEGYGAGIGNAGRHYLASTVNFIMFDVLVGKWWLQRSDIMEIANKLDISIVPFVGYMTINEACDYVKKGFASNIAEEKGFEAEGLVMKNPLGLLNRGGQRIMTKIKTCDFRELERKTVNYC